MAVLSAANRGTCHADFQRQASATRESLACLKGDLLAAFNAIDDWLELNVASFNLAIPLPARTVLSARQKARLLALVAEKRLEVS